MKTFEYAHIFAQVKGSLLCTYTLTLDLEVIDPLDPPSVWGPARIYLHAGDEEEQEEFHDALTPHQARDLAALLLIAADAVERGVA